MTSPTSNAVALVERPDEVEDDHLPLDMALTLLSDCTDMASYAGAGSANVAYVARLSKAELQSQAARIAELEGSLRAVMVASCRSLLSEKVQKPASHGEGGA